MSIQRFGRYLIVAGFLGGASSLLADYLGIGSGGVQAAQLLGVQIGFVIILIGYGLTRIDREKKIPSFRSILFKTVERVLNSKPQVWFFVTFFGVYVWLFIMPIFLNSELQMQYFNRFLPHGGRIGMDMRAIVDYIHNWLVLGQSPYSSGFIAYPPLTLVFFSPFLLIGYPAYFYAMTILTLACHLIAALVIPLLITNRKNESLSILIFVTSLLSYGFQFELERAQFNIIAFTLALSAIYVFYHYPKLRLIAYILITISIQLKIYPAIFLLLFIENWRDWKRNAVRLSVLGLANFAALFVLGPKLFVEFVAAVRGQQSYGPSWNGNHSVQGFANQLVLDGFGLIPDTVLAAWRNHVELIQLILLIIFALCLALIMIVSYRRDERGLNAYLLFVCTVGALILPSISNDYKLSILTAPMIIVAALAPVFDQEMQMRKTFYILLLVIASSAYWVLQYPFKFKPEILSRSFLPLFVLLLVISVLGLLANWNRRTTEAES